MNLAPKPLVVRAVTAASLLLAGSGGALAHPGHDEVPGLLADLAHGLGFDPAPVAAASGWLALAVVSGLLLPRVGRAFGARLARYRASRRAATAASR